MTTFVAVYRGDTVATSRLVAVSADPLLVNRVVGQLLVKADEPVDPALAQLFRGRRAALRVVSRELGCQRRGQ